MKWDDPSAFALSAYRSPGFGRKKLDAYASSATRLHPLVGDWICGAPILAVALNDQRYYQGLFDLAHQRGRLVDALRICHLPTPMRKQTAVQADQWHVLPGWRSTFPEMPDSELAQLLARITERRIRADWARNIQLALKRRPPATEFGAFARWAVRTAANESRQYLIMALDFMHENEFDLAWTKGQFERAHRAWVERMQATWELRREAAYEARNARDLRRAEREEKLLDLVVDFSPFPTEITINGVSIHALDTPRKLLAEGAKMRHCVGGSQFRQALVKGRAVYFHLEAPTERSTLEIQRDGARFLISQHCGPCNQRPSATLSEAASALRLAGHEASFKASVAMEE